MFADFAEEATDLGDLGEIGLEGRRSIAFTRDGFGFAARIAVMDRDVEAAAGKFDCDDSANAFGCAGDQDAGTVGHFFLRYAGTDAWPARSRSLTEKFTNRIAGIGDVLWSVGRGEKTRFELRRREVDAAVQQVVEEAAEGFCV